MCFDYINSVVAFFVVGRTFGTSYVRPIVCSECTRHADHTRGEHMQRVSADRAFGAARMHPLVPSHLLIQILSNIANICGRRVQLEGATPDVAGEILDVPELPGALFQLPSTQHPMEPHLVELVDDPSCLLITM